MFKIKLITASFLLAFSVFCIAETGSAAVSSKNIGGNTTKAEPSSTTAAESMKNAKRTNPFEPKQGSSASSLNGVTPPAPPGANPGGLANNAFFNKAGSSANNQLQNARAKKQNEVIDGDILGKINGKTILKTGEVYELVKE